MAKILVIDDKKDNLIVMSAMLTRMIDKCQVITAGSGKEGLEKAETQAPDTILLDIKMPGMDGYEVCRRLKKNTVTRYIPVIMISALKTESADLARGLECGADAYLAKPVDGYVVTAQVNTALRIKRSEDLLRSQKQLLEDMVKERTEKLYLSQKKLDIKNKIAESFLFENDEESYLKVINVTMDALQSHHGTIGYIDENDSLVWTAMPGRSFEHCRTQDKTLVFPKEKWTGLWGKALAGKKTFSSNGPFHLPGGHMDITRAIVTPLLYKGELVGCILLANKDSDYTNDDSLLLEEIAQYIAPVVHARLLSYWQNQKKKELEAQLLHAQKMQSIGILAGGIAHDFNNILFPIVGISEMMMGDISPDSPEQENLRAIYNAGTRGRDLVKHILAVGRQSEDNTLPVQIQKVLKEVLKLSRSTIPSNIEIKTDIQEDCCAINANPTRLHQIAMNLITNAYHTVEHINGTISVELKEIVLKKNNASQDAPSLEPGRYVLLSVADTGSGIDPKILDKIFVPYFTTKGKEKGTGLGLSVVYGIIKEYKGDIKVFSEPGKGTRFNVYLPPAENSSEDTPKKENISLPMGSEHILLVDDEVSIARVEEIMLERLGYQVTSCTSSLDALEKIKADPHGFDLLLTDMTMPGMTGETLAQKVHSLRPDLGIIMCTGFSESINREKALATGIKAFLMKPVLIRDIADTVRNVLDET